MSPLPREADREALLPHARTYIAECATRVNYPPTGGVCKGTWLNKWLRTDVYDAQTVYLVERSYQGRRLVTPLPEP